MTDTTETPDRIVIITDEPPPLSPPRQILPFDLLKVGHSFVVSDADTNRVRAAAQYRSRRTSERYMTRRLPDGRLQVWRTA